LQEDRFPRALYDTLLEVESCLHAMPKHEKPLRLVKKLQRVLQRAKPQELKQEKLHEFIDVLQLGLITINDSISKTYF
jgi:uncharacterized alpha-E superfamily protein